MRNVCDIYVYLYTLAYSYISMVESEKRVTVFFYQTVLVAHENMFISQWKYTLVNIFT